MHFLVRLSPSYTLEMMRKTAILGSGFLLTVLVTAGLSLADGLFLTSTETASEGAIHAVAKLKPIKSSQKQKRAYLAATTTPTSSKPSKPTLLPAVVQSDITPAHQKLADTVLRALPSGCRDRLRNFYVQYTGAKSRGLGGKTTIILTGDVSDEEFAALLTHECAHVIHSNWTGTAKTETAFKDGKDVFRTDSPMVDFFSISWTSADILKADAKKADFLSGYAQSDAFEDFAEAFAMYILHRDAFETRAKSNTAIAAKLNWMKTYLPTNDDLLGTSRYNWDKTVPWDVTRLPYTLASVR